MRREKKKINNKIKIMKKYGNARSLHNVIGSNVYEVSKKKVKLLKRHRLIAGINTAMKH